MRTSIALGVMAALVLGTGVTAAASPEIRIFQSAQDGAITEGETMIFGEPDAAYRAATDYARWSAMFPDIRRVIVTSLNGNDARVTFIHAAGNRDNLHFRNQPAARMVWFEDTGGRAEVWAEIVFLPGDRAGTTRVHSRLYVDVHGLASLFVSDRELREIREQRIRDELAQLRAYFAREVDAKR